MSGLVISGIPTRAEGKSLYIGCNGQRGRECCKWLVKCIDREIRILQQFKINE